MKTRNILYSALLLLLSGLTFTSCDDYLDVMPDNRTVIDNEEKVKKLLTSAYAENTHVLFTEYMSDNVDEFPNTNTSRFLDQIYHWEDITETNNESPERYWESSYASATAANMALEGIDKVGGATNTTLRECKAEALLCRAYAHFMLVNIFSKAYNSKTSDKDLGIYYQYETASKIGEVHDRGTVAEVYEKIDKDIQEALPLIGDTHYDVPKFHFNQKAAYAFAAKFYLYYEQWDKAIEYANKCLGSAPRTMLRDWSYYSTLASNREAYTLHYVASELNCNLLLLTGYSVAGVAFGNWSSYKKYTHGPYTDSHETSKASNIWGDAEFYDGGTKPYTSTSATYNIFWRLPYLFQYTDAVRGIGYYKTIYPAFTTDECLLNRAEAYIHKKNYDAAAADLTMWMQNIINTGMTLTPQSINDFYKPIAYSYDADGLSSTIKKHLHPTFEIGEEGSIDETMYQCLLGFRRIEQLETGQRWFDVKRFGIEILRRQMGANGMPAKATDKLSVDDERRAIQLPQRVIDSGMTPNPRK